MPNNQLRLINRRAGSPLSEQERLAREAISAGFAVQPEVNQNIEQIPARPVDLENPPMSDDRFQTMKEFAIKKPSQTWELFKFSNITPEQREELEKIAPKPQPLEAKPKSDFSKIRSKFRKPVEEKYPAIE